jgi:hypothetical protein
MSRGKFKMRGGALACPPGFHCMDTGTILLGLLIFFAFAAIIVFVLKYNGFFGEPVKPTVVVVESKREPPISVSMTTEDPRFNPRAPERTYSTSPDLRGFPFGASTRSVPINVPTGGYPETYQQMGVLTAPGGTETSGTPTRTILPLFGRRLATGRDRFNYYTRTDGINPVQVPIQFKRRNCDDDLGCEEINDGDSIGVPIMGQSFTASIYRNSTPRYIPNV